MRRWMAIGTAVLLSVWGRPGMGGTLRMERLEADLKAGKLSEETVLLYKAYSVLAPERVPSIYRTDGFNKCGTGTLLEVLGKWNTLGSRAKSALSPLLRRPVLSYSYPSESGRFRIHYDMEGGDAVDRTDKDGDGVPDIVELAAAYFDSAYVLEVEELGYREPVPDDEGGDEAWDVYMRELSTQRVYGYTTPGHRVGRSYSYTSFVEIDNGFTEEHVYPTVREDALKITAAHEFFHVIQFSYYGLSGMEWWMEMTATWMEDVAYDEVNDYYNYLGSPFNTPFTHPEQALDRRDNQHEYGASVFAHYLSERFGRDVIRSIWENVASTGQADMRPLDRMIPGGLKAALPEFYAWNYFTGKRARPDVYYEEGAYYPQVHMQHRHRGYPAEGEGSVEHLGATYIQFEVPPDRAVGGLSVQFDEEDVEAWEERLIKVTRAQNVEIEALSGGRGEVADWSYYEDLVLVGVVTAPSGYRFPYRYVGEQDTSFAKPPPDVASLDAPYPNPFLVRDGDRMRRVTIPFGLSKTAEVVVSVHTVEGALVWRVRLGALGPRYYEDLVRWDGRNERGVVVGSGMYVVQMNAGGFRAQRIVVVVREK